MGVSRAVIIAFVVGNAAPARAQPAKGHETRLTLAEAVRSALANHPDLRRLALDTQIADAEVTRQRGLFDPLLAFHAYGRSDSTWTDEAEATQNGVNVVDTIGGSASLGGRTTFGGNYSLSFRTTRIADQGQPGFFIRTVPQYENIAMARYTQSLRRDAGSTPNQGLIDRAEISADISRADQRTQIEQLSLRVVAAYWNLVVQHERVGISEASLAEAVKIREFVERQIRAGKGNRSEITQADVTVGERQQAVDVASLNVIEAERVLLDVTYPKGTLGPDDALVLIDRPGTQPSHRDFEQELAAALDNRPEFRAARRAVELAELNEAIADNQQRIRVDVYGEAGLVGFAGTNVVPLNDPNMTPAPPPLVQGGIAKSLTNMVRAEAPFFEVGLQVEIPLGNRERTAVARQAALARDKARAVDVKSVVSHEVRAALQRVVLSSRRLATAAATVKLAEDNVNAQELRYKGGAGILFDVLRAQEQLAGARASAALAAAEQEVALMRLEASRGTLLAHLGIKP